MTTWTRFVAGGTLIAAVVCGSLAGCSSDEAGKPKGILQERQEKDAEFRTEYSPLPPDQQEHFEGLRYYELSEQYNVQAQLEVFQKPDTVQIAATKSDDIRTMVRYGVFTFTVDDTACRLTAYRNTGAAAEHYPNLLFVPFRDKTTGDETYSAGRYLDVGILPETTVYQLNFNRAYNPYCAYNDAYSCPLVPEENTLPVAIRAGEKKYGH